jgi:hypothetical protein
MYCIDCHKRFICGYTYYISIGKTKNGVFFNKNQFFIAEQNITDRYGIIGLFALTGTHTIPTLTASEVIFFDQLITIFNFFVFPS